MYDAICVEIVIKTLSVGDYALMLYHFGKNNT